MTRDQSNHSEFTDHQNLSAGKYILDKSYSLLIQVRRRRKKRRLIEEIRARRNLLSKVIVQIQMSNVNILAGTLR